MWRKKTKTRADAQSKQTEPTPQDTSSQPQKKARREVIYKKYIGYSPQAHAKADVTVYRSAEGYEINFGVSPGNMSPGFGSYYKIPFDFFSNNTFEDFCDHYDFAYALSNGYDVIGVSDSSLREVWDLLTGDRAAEREKNEVGAARPNCAELS